MVAYFASATATDADGNVLQVNHDGPSFFSVGTTTVTFTAQDNKGNEVTPTSSVWVDFVDVEKPVITVPEDQTVRTFNYGGVTVEHPDVQAFIGQFSAKDNIDGQLTGTVDAPTLYPVGTTSVRYYATDEAGNTGIGEANVLVQVSLIAP